MKIEPSWVLAERNRVVIRPRIHGPNMARLRQAYTSRASRCCQRRRAASARLAAGAPAGPEPRPPGSAGAAPAAGAGPAGAALLGGVAPVASTRSVTGAFLVRGARTPLAAVSVAGALERSGPGLPLSWSPRADPGTRVPINRPPGAYWLIARERPCPPGSAQSTRLRPGPPGSAPVHPAPPPVDPAPLRLAWLTLPAKRRRAGVSRRRSPGSGPCRETLRPGRRRSASRARRTRQRCSASRQR